MTVGPGIGLAYPDGGKVASWHGAPLIQNISGTVNGVGTSSQGRYAVNAWESLDVNMAAAVGPLAVVLTWSLDSAGLVPTGAWSGVAVAGTPLWDNVPNMGPYVSVGVQNLVGGNLAFSGLSVLARQGTKLPPVQGNPVGFAFIDTNVPNGGNSVAQGRFTRSGPAIVSTYLNAANMQTVLTVTDQNGVSRPIWTSPISAAILHLCEPIILPPLPITGTIFNTGAAPAAGRLFVDVGRA